MKLKKKTLQNCEKNNKIKREQEKNLHKHETKAGLRAPASVLCGPGSSSGLSAGLYVSRVCSKCCSLAFHRGFSPVFLWFSSTPRKKINQ